MWSFVEPQTADRGTARDGEQHRNGAWSDAPEQRQRAHLLHFLAPHLHLHSLFGDDWLALNAEGFARFFGTPTFLIGQTAIVTIWVLINVLGLTRFDIYPFILLNLAFSLQAAYAAPLILLAQTRQADRDTAHVMADAQHRKASQAASEERAALAAQQTGFLVEMLQQNTQLAETVRALAERVEALTPEVRKAVVTSRGA